MMRVPTRSGSSSTRAPYLLIFTFMLFAISASTSLSAISTTVTISSKQALAAYGVPVTFVATMSPTSVPNGEKVTLYDGGSPIATNSLTKGTTYFVLSNLTAGSHTITASYPGDNTFTTSTSKPITQTISYGSASIILTSSASTSTFSQPVTFTLILSGNVPNGDQVTFYDHYSVIGTGTTVSGRANLTLSTLSVGTHSITAVYAGDVNFGGRTSSAITQTVKASATTTSVTSTLVGHSVKLTAIITPSTGVVPNGENITLKDGTSVLTVLKTVSGSVTYTSAALASGSHTITAVYPGDGNFLSSTSPTVQLSNGVPTGGGPKQSCTLGINVTSASPSYLAPQKVVILYSVKSIGTSSCNIASATGTLSLSGAASGEVYTSIPINVTNILSIPVTRIAYLNSSAAPFGESLAVMVLSSGSISNLSTTSVYVLQPANLSITKLGILGGNATHAGSPISISAVVLNNGVFPASNTSINFKIIAPNLSTYKFQEPLEWVPGFRNITAVVSPGILGIPNQPGKYLVLANLSFYSNYTLPSGAYYSSNAIYSNTTSVQYVVSPNTGTRINPSYLPPSRIGPVKITTFPIYEDVLWNSNLNDLDSPAFFNPGTNTVTINMTIPRVSFGTFSKTAESITLAPNKSGILPILFTPGRNVSGAYVIPINISVAVGNSTAPSTALYSVVNIYNKASNLQPLTNLDVINGNTTALVNMTINNTVNTTYYNLQLFTGINRRAISQQSGITTLQGFGNITTINTTTLLEWPIGKLPGYNNTQVGYNITSISASKYLMFAPSILSYTSQSNLTAFYISSVSVPPYVYTNSTINITVSGVYTGPNETSIPISLTPIAGANVLNPQQFFKVTPDTVVNARFTVKTGPFPGNESFQLTTPGTFTTHVQLVKIPVTVKPVVTFTIQDYLSDPRTIFGILTLMLYIVNLAYGRISRVLKERKLRVRSTVKTIDGLRDLEKKIAVALLDEGVRKRTFRRHENKDDGLGGFVEDTAIVGRDVTVEIKAIISDNAIVSGNTKIMGRATVSTHSIVRGSAMIYDNATVGDSAEVYGNAKIYGTAKVFGQSEIYDNAKVHDECEVYGNARVFGEAEIGGDAKIYGSAQISGSASIKKGDMHRGEKV